MSNFAKRVSLVSITGENNQRVIVRGLSGEEHEAELMLIGGTSTTPLPGWEGLVLPVMGDHEHLVAFGFTQPTGRPEGPEGGYLLHSTAEGHTLSLTPDGVTTLTTPSGGTFTLDGNKITTNMDIETTGDVLAGGISLKTHTHPVPSGGGTSGVPN